MEDDKEYHFTFEANFDFDSSKRETKLPKPNPLKYVIPEGLLSEYSNNDSGNSLQQQQQHSDSKSNSETKSETSGVTPARTESLVKILNQDDPSKPTIEVKTVKIRREAGTGKLITKEVKTYSMGKTKPSTNSKEIENQIQNQTQRHPKVATEEMDKASDAVIKNFFKFNKMQSETFGSFGSLMGGFPFHRNGKEIKHLFDQDDGVGKQKPCREHLSDSRASKRQNVQNSEGKVLPKRKFTTQDNFRRQMLREGMPDRW